MNKEEYRLRDGRLAVEIASQVERLKELERQRDALKDEYLAANAIAIGQPVIYRQKKTAEWMPSHKLDGQLCHVYYVDEYANAFRYKIRKAKKDGTMARVGADIWGVTEDELEVMES